MDYVDIKSNQEAWYERFIEDYMANGWLESLAVILATRNFNELYNNLTDGGYYAK